MSLKESLYLLTAVNNIVKEYNDQSYAKIKSEFYDLDTFIQKCSKYQDTISSQKSKAKVLKTEHNDDDKKDIETIHAYNQREITAKVNLEIKQLLEGVEADLENIKKL